MEKAVKFRDYLVPLILSGEKDTTWRLFDDKNLQEKDVVELVNWNTGEIFGKAELTEVREKKMGELDDSDFDGHEKFADEEEMYATYREYYGDAVGPETVVKIIQLRVL